MSDMQLLLFGAELRTRAREILVRAENTDDQEAQEAMRVIAASYQKLALRMEQRVQDAYKGAVAARSLRAAARAAANQARYRPDAVSRA